MRPNFDLSSRETVSIEEAIVSNLAPHALSVVYAVLLVMNAIRDQAIYLPYLLRVP